MSRCCERGCALPENDERDGLLVVDVTGVCGEPVHAAELTAIGFTANPACEIVEDLALVVALRLSAGQLGHRLLRRQPVTRTLAVEVPGVLVKPPESVSEYGGCVAWEGRAERDPHVLDASVRRMGTALGVAAMCVGRRSKEDRAGHPLRRLNATERRVLSIQTSWEAAWAGDIHLDDRLPVVVELIGDLLEDVNVV